MTESPIVIMGAGPAGAATALKLSYLGIPSVLIDRATFPRDKVCGDALSGKVAVLLDRLDPAIMDRLRVRYQPTDVWGVRFSAPSARCIDLPFSADYVRNPAAAPGYVAKRMDFDNFLVEEVQRRDNISFHHGTEIGSWEKTDEGYVVTTKDGTQSWSCRLLIDGSGAHSRFSRKEAGMEVDHDHHAAAVRAYYRGVTGFHADNFIELHFLNDYCPGYFWIFPLPNGEANVGLGMRSDILKKKGTNLRKALDEIVASPQFRDRFAGAEQIDPTVGYGLPLGSKERVLSGDNYLLIGDAGHLIDPLTGEGIGNGIYSGFIAAELAEKCIAENRFDADYLAAYDVRIARVLRSEMKVSYRLQQTLQWKALTNLIARVIAANPKVLNAISILYTDLEARRQLFKPWFWWRLFRQEPGHVAMYPEGSPDR